MVSRLIALAVVTAALLSPATAFADETSSPSPSSSPTAPAEAPVGDGTAISVTLANDSEKGPDGLPAPIEGVTLTVTSEDGVEVGEDVTDAEGKANVPLPSAGTYTVTLDEDTLPEGTELDSSTRTELEIRVLISGSATNAQFPIGVQAADTTSFATKLIDSIVSGIKFGLIIALAALGLSLIFGATGLTNFAHGELITLGGLVTYWFNRDLGLPVIVAGILAVIASGIFGWAQDRVLWQPLRRRGTGLIAMMIVSIGFGLFLRSIYQYLFGSSTRSLDQYTTQVRHSWGPIHLADKEIAIILVSVVAIAVVCIAMMTTRLGKAMRAVSDNPALSASSGMRVDAVIRNAWIIGTALSGLAGVLYAINSQVKFDNGFKLLLLVFAAVTLGGLGTIWGALIGSLVIGIVVEVGPTFGVPSSIKEVGALVVLILILLVRPQGILGRRERIG
ncbi:SpaA isopeptide-forming pilin-related protein [Nocardioides sp. W7]|uniref:ABC transporter permease subunit n=1 Tax=Nocardioides sp. W7 TaxID=2931390 RepID=UPI001FD0293E|nr:SpaA isopeptide-forming pilin-related protein [Nocardioides sp. W7]